MAISRDQLTERLALAEPDDLCAVLVAAGLEPQAEADARGLAQQLTAALWWRTHTPLGQAVLPDSLDRIVDRFARKLNRRLPEGDGFAKLEALTAAVLPGGRVKATSELDPELRARLARGHGAAITGLFAGTGAAATRIVSWKLLSWTRGPVWDLVPLVPKLGPIFLAVRTGAATAAKLSAPVGLAMALLSLNATFGAADDEALPLLVGAGLLVRELPGVQEAVVVEVA